jgi:hypothetical protein
MATEKVSGFKTSDGQFFIDKEKAESHEGFFQERQIHNKRIQILRDMKLKIGNHGAATIAANFDEILGKFAEAGVD